MNFNDWCKRYFKPDPMCQDEDEQRALAHEKHDAWLKAREEPPKPVNKTSEELKVHDWLASKGKAIPMKIETIPEPVTHTVTNPVTHVTNTKEQDVTNVTHQEEPEPVSNRNEYLRQYRLKNRDTYNAQVRLRMQRYRDKQKAK